MAPIFEESHPVSRPPSALLYRQRTILYLLHTANRPVGRLELMKWAFLLAKEQPSAGGSAFYQFLPYKHGPYSFCLSRELDTLVSEGYVSAPDKNNWMSTDRTAPAVDQIPDLVKKDVLSIINQFGSAHGPNQVLNYVYSRFHWFTANAKRVLDRRAERPIAVPAVYTIGYEGQSLDGFLNLLLAGGIQRLLDVRRNPIARRFGFHRSTLERHCSLIDIEYISIPELGIASELRQRLSDMQSYQNLFEQYNKETLANETLAVQRVVTLMQEKPTVLVCMEANPTCCHRSQLASVVSECTGFDIIHLRS